MKNIKCLLVVLLFWGCSGIAFKKSPEKKYEEISGMTFQYPKQDVFDACVSSLEANGWAVRTANYETGAISGVRRQNPGAAAETAPVQQTATVSVVEKASGQIEVKITAGLSSPNPAGEGAGSALVVKNMPKVCAPLLTSVQETLLKSRQNAVK